MNLTILYFSLFDNASRLISKIHLRRVNTSIRDFYNSLRNSSKLNRKLLCLLLDSILTPSVANNHLQHFKMSLFDIGGYADRAVAYLVPPEESEFERILRIAFREYGYEGTKLGGRMMELAFFKFGAKKLRGQGYFLRKRISESRLQRLLLEYTEIKAALKIAEAEKKEKIRLMKKKEEQLIGEFVFVGE